MSREAEDCMQTRAHMLQVPQKQQRQRGDAGRAGGGDKSGNA